MAEPTKKTRGEKACDAFAAHLISVPLGSVICGGGLSTSWSQYSELGKAAWEAAADTVRADALEEAAMRVLIKRADMRFSDQREMCDEIAADLRSLKFPEKPA
jgi:hypothetical protein